MALTRTFKLRYPTQGREDEVRRLTLEENGLDLVLLRDRTKQLFKLQDDCTWQFKWKDEDGDLVTLTEEYEFQDLLVLKRNETLVRLVVVVDHPSAPAVNRCPVFAPGGFSSHFQPELCGSKFGGLCDVTNIKLRPGNGQWYHKPNSRNDLCKYEYDKLSDEEKGLYVLINHAGDLGNDMIAYQLGWRGGRGNRCPYRGSNRHHGNSGDRSFAMGWCDMTDAVLKVGEGWYHKPGTTYDVCEAAYQALPDDQKKDFVRIDQAADLGNEISRYTHHVPSFLRQSYEETPANVCASESVSTQTKKVPKTMEVVSGPSVLRGAKVKAGSRLMPVWEVKNTSPSGLWTDVRLKPTGDNPFKISENGFEVPVLESGSSGILSIDLTVPEDAPAGLTKAELVMVDNDGDAFGHVLLLEIDVVRDEVIVDEKLRTLLDMGFSDLEACKSALIACNGDVSAATLALLRGSRA